MRDMAGNSSEQCTYLIGKHRIDQSGDLSVNLSYGDVTLLI